MMAMGEFDPSEQEEEKDEPPPPPPVCPSTRFAVIQRIECVRPMFGLIGHTRPLISWCLCLRVSLRSAFEARVAYAWAGHYARNHITRSHGHLH
jgi:hypothetical protein